MSTAKLILYNFARSSCSWRVRAMLEHKKLSYQYRPVMILKGEHNEDQFQKLNPAQMVPALVVQTENNETKTLFESLAIIDYLEHAYPNEGESIYPADDPFLRANVLAISEMIVSGIQPLQNVGVMRFARKFAQGDKSKDLEWAQYWIENKFEKLENVLKNHSGRFTVGDQFTLADICLVPQVYNAKRYAVNMNRYPLINRLYENGMSIESIDRSKPENQIDFK
ncbi:Glutathione S-transferase zeta-1 [Blomia tropicalis]|nr:Glutathione S-transferase zeta-1 [Blomia tropicalis]